MSTRNFDAVVVGGGPAGASAAVTLAAGGLKVALLDKAAFPRHKLCGGLITLRTRRLLTQVFGAECEPPIERTSSGAKVYFEDRYLNGIEGYKPLYFTSRCTFDHHLVEQARSRGVEVIEGAAATGLTPDRTAVMTADGTRYETGFIIGADGASSRVRKQLDSVSMDKDGFAVGLEMEMPSALIGRTISEPEIYLGVVNWGYGWIFPKANALTVGVGGLASENDDMRQVFERFLRMVSGAVPDLPIKGHPIPFGNYVARPGQGSVLLVGDAAGLVEPMTGEGIAFSIQSGFYAAQAIIEAQRLGVPSAALHLYSKRYREIADLFDDARLLRYLAFGKPVAPLFARALSASSGLIRKYMDVLAGDLAYRAYARYLMGTAIRRLPRLFKSVERIAA